MEPKLTITDIDREIAVFQNSLLMYPRSHPEHIISVHTLVVGRLLRYFRSQQKEDLDISIAHCTEAIFLPPVSRAGHNLNIVELLCLLVEALLIRSEKFEQPRDIKYAIEYLRYLRGLPLDTLGQPRRVVISLIRALAIQVESEAGDRTPKIEEMVVLCRELLTSNISADFPIASFVSLRDAVSAEYNRGRTSIQSLDQVIECLRDAVKLCPPGSYIMMLSLAEVYQLRTMVSPSIDDFEEMTALLERIADPSQPGECPDSIKDQVSLIVSMLPFTRLVTFQNPQYSEEAISSLRSLLSSPSIDKVVRFATTGAFAICARDRFEIFNLAESLEEANSYDSQVVDFISSQSQEKSGEPLPGQCATRESYLTRAEDTLRRIEEVFSDTPTPHDKSILLSVRAGLYKVQFLRTNDISDIEESIKYFRLSLDAIRSSDELLSAFSLSNLSDILLFAFNETGEITYLDESITLGYDILELRSARHIHFLTIRQLVPSLLTREQLLGGREGHHEAIRLISMVVDDQFTPESNRFQLSCKWARLARSISHSTTLTAYKNAMSLMQQSLSFAPTVSIQHARLVAMGVDCQTMPLDYASFQIDLGQFEEAVETLEQGRALIWSEMRGLRSPVAQLVEDCPLAGRFAEINEELEALTISVTPSGKPEMEDRDGVAQCRDGTDPFGRFLVKRKKLAEEREALILQIQGQPGSEGFLQAPSFTTLRSAASRGPVILINHCRWRSDILILFHDSLSCSIPTAHDFYDRANELRDKLMGARKVGLDSGKYQHALRTVLRDLYELIGQPVIEKFQALGLPEQSRIWWCPSSVFCSLPLHAMGPIPSDHMPKPCKPSKRYFSDLYISSYTPSLSALIEARKPSAQALDQPSLLLVAQLDQSLPGAWGEIQVMQNLNVPVTSLISKWATPSSVVEGLRSHRFAHFTCHGNLERGKPFDASFQLHGKERLTLLDIVQSRLPNAEFAFLSCCHAAEITEESVADEALHLTAAMQYCGFRSVVGTMWEMADTDGRDLADNFYKSLFSSREEGVPYYERSARALRDAARKLRRKEGITLERWVNFVHYGA